MWWWGTEASRRERDRATSCGKMTWSEFINTIWMRFILLNLYLCWVRMCFPSLSINIHSIKWKRFHTWHDWKCSKCTKTQTKRRQISQLHLGRYRCQRRRRRRRPCHSNILTCMRLKHFIIRIGRSIVYFRLAAKR